LQNLLTPSSSTLAATVNMVLTLPRRTNVGRMSMSHAKHCTVRSIVAHGLALTLVQSAGIAVAGPAPPAMAARPPVVVQAVVDRVEPDRLVIRGRNFSAGASPIVLLSGVRLQVVSFSDDEIVARLPLDAPPARYRLQVLARGQRPSASFEVTLGRRSGSTSHIFPMSPQNT
jgi:hypothetical protein